MRFLPCLLPANPDQDRISGVNYIISPTTGADFAGARLLFGLLSTAVGPMAATSSPLLPCADAERSHGSLSAGAVSLVLIALRCILFAVWNIGRWKPGWTVIGAVASLTVISLALR